MAVSGVTGAMANNIYSAIASKNKGMGGLVSGLDTESLVEALTAATRNKINKQMQNRTLLEWKQTAYRDVATTLRGFQTKYFDRLSAGNMKDSNFYNTLKGSSTNDAITVKPTSAGSAGTLEINAVESLATSAKYASKQYKKELTSTVEYDTQNYLNKTLTLQLDDKAASTYTIDLTSLEGSTDFEGDLQRLINQAVGTKSDGTTPIVKVTVDASKHVSFSSDSNKITVSGGSDVFGFEGGESNRITTNSTLADVFGGDLNAVNDTIKFAINGVDFEFKTTDTVAKVITQVNNSGANVKLAFNSLGQNFTLTANKLGAGNTLDIHDVQGTFLSGMFGVQGSSQLTTSANNYTYGYNTTLNGAVFTGTGTEAQLLYEKIRDSSSGSAKFGVKIGNNTYDMEFSFTASEITKLDAILADSSKSAAEKDLAIKNAIGSKIAGALEAEGIRSQVYFNIEENGQLTFKAADSDTKFELTSGGYASGDVDLITELGFTSANNNLTNSGTSKTLGDVFGITGSGVLKVETSRADGTPIVSKQIAYTAATTLEELEAALGGTLKIVDGKIVIDAGGGNILKVTDTSGSSGALNAIFGVDSYETQAANPSIGSYTAGKNAEVIVNGERVTSSDNKFSINGIEFEVNKLYNNGVNGDNSTNAAITLTTTVDHTELVDKIKDYIDDYNALVKSLTTIIREDKADGGYSPLTDEQKAEMTEDQIKKWENEAKKGLLRNDSTIQGILNQMRRTLYETVEAAGLAPFEIGLETVSMMSSDKSIDSSKAGLIELDEDKLLKALESNASAVKTMFTDSEGLVAKLDEIIDKAVNKSSAKDEYGVFTSRGTLVQLAGTKELTGDNTSQIGDRLKAIDSNISNLKLRLEKEYNRYWRQFSALETAIARMSSQSSWLAEQSA